MCNSKFHKNAPKNDYIRRRKVLNQQEDNENFMLFQKELHVWSSLWILQKKCFSIFKYSLQSAVSLGKIWEEEWQEKVGWQASSPLVSFPAYSQDGHIVSLNKSNGWRCDKPACVCVQIHRVSTTVLFLSQVTACSSRRGASAVFTLLLDGNCAISLLAESLGE